MSSWINTKARYRHELGNPTPEMIQGPEELASVLNRIPRFGGTTDVPWSVLQHSCFVCDLVQEPELKLYALLHDAHEAYTGFGDPARPWKERIPELKQYELLLDKAIAERFGLDPEMFYRPEIKQADNLALVTEAHFLNSPSVSYEDDPSLPQPLNAWPNAQYTEAVFLDMFRIYKQSYELLMRIVWLEKKVKHLMVSNGLF